MEPAMSGKIRQLLIVLCLYVLLSPLLGYAAVFNLTDNGREIAVTFLFEPGGYLASTLSTTGQSALDVYNANNQADILQWTRDNTMQDPSGALEMALFWWAWKNEGVQWAVADLPSESSDWVTILDGFIASIDAALANIGRNDRDAQSAQTLHIRSGPLRSMPSGTHLVEQRAMYVILKAFLN